MSENNPLDLLKGVKTMNEAIERNTQPVVYGVDFPGDEAWLPFPHEEPKPALIVNPEATSLEMLSSMVARLKHSIDLIWNLSNLVDDQQDVGAFIYTLGRMNTEAFVLGEACMRKLINDAGQVKKAKAKS